MIQSLQRGFAILELLDRDDPDREGMGAQEIATRMGLKFPTAHNFLKSLTELGYLERVIGNGKYRLATKLCRLGNAAFRERLLETVAKPEIERMGTELGETVSLSVELDFFRRTLVAKECDKELRVVQRRSDDQLYRYPVGRVHLSRMIPERLEQYVERKGLPGDNWPGVSTRRDLDDALAAIRREGCAVKENREVGAAAIGVPIEGLPDDMNAALCFVCPLTRFNAAKCRTVVAELQKAARTIAGGVQRA